MKVICKMLFGSTLYGTKTLNSDTDYKSIYIPTLEEYLLQSVRKTIEKNTNQSSSKNLKEDVDHQFISLNYFIDQCLEGQTYALDMLHAPSGWEEITSPIWEDLKSKRHLFYTKDLKSYMGYLKKQVAKYSIKGSRLDTAEKIIKWCKTSILQNSITPQTSFNSYLKIIGYPNPCADPSSIPHIYESYEIAKKSGKTHLKGLKIGSVIKSLPNLQHVQKIENGMFDDYSTLIVDDSSSYIEILEKKFEYTSYVENILESISKYYKGYGDRARLAQENQMIDWKAVSHAFRAAFQLKEILETGTLQYPLKEFQFLIDLKTMKYHWVEDQIPEKLDLLVRDIQILSSSSPFPEKPDSSYWKSWLLETLKSLYTS